MDVIRGALVLLLINSAFFVASGVQSGRAVDHDGDGKKVYIVFTQRQPKGAWESDDDIVGASSTIESFHHRLLSDALDSSGAPERVVYHYTRSLHGFAARLTEQEKNNLAGKDGILSIHERVANSINTFPDTTVKRALIVDPGNWENLQVSRYKGAILLWPSEKSLDEHRLFSTGAAGVIFPAGDTTHDHSRSYSIPAAVVTLAQFHEILHYYNTTSQTVFDAEAPVAVPAFSSRGPNLLTPVPVPNYGVSFSTVIPRAATNVGPVDSVYRIKISSAPGISISVEPEELVFSAAKKRISFTVTVSGTLSRGVGDRLGASASIVWSDGKHQQVRSPQSVRVRNNSPPTINSVNRALIINWLVSTT
ncbi:hypothetical protein EJB05_14857 [Eragrostis curvula]|uniref:Inhibitor I9 domain-containing protein n=1 Tax=Eragrostis curvula TaxID=38414 RepID=A0A5J9W1Y8_9POAL|nr:hypothetical protein EJB05_14857 [Eragrostis curvula]